MSDAILFGGLAVLMVAWGVQSWLTDLGEARKTEAEARLIEAENARAALAPTTPEGRTDRVGSAPTSSTSTTARGRDA